MIRVRLSIPTFRLRANRLQPMNPHAVSVKQGDAVIDRTGRVGTFVATNRDHPVIAWKHGPETFPELVARFKAT